MKRTEVHDLGAVIIMPPPPPPAIVRTVNLEDAAFESQHPRGAGGRFTAKSKSNSDPPPIGMLERDAYLGERPADPGAQAFVDRTVAMLRRLGFNVPKVVVTTIPNDTMKVLTTASQMAEGDEAAAFAQPGRMVLNPGTEKAFREVEQRIAKWGSPKGEIPTEADQNAMRVAVHELLHQVTSMREWEAAKTSGDALRFLDGAQTEEGVVEAVTLDVCNQWGRKWGITFPFYPPGTLVFEAPGQVSSYKDRTVHIRKLSEKWAGANWRSKAATKWRRAFLHADYAKRKVMIAEVERRGGVKLSEKNVSVRQYIRDGRLVRAHRRRLDVKAIAQTIDTESRLPRPGTVHVRRAGTADQEKTSYALSRLLDFHLIEPNDVQATFLASSWPTMRTYLEQIWREKDNPAHKTLPEEFRPGGKYRVPFRAAINPATIDRMDYILTKGRDRAADVLEKALSGKTVEAERSGRVPMIGPGWEPGEGRKMKIDLAVRAQYWANFYEESRAEVRHYSDEYGVDRDTVTAIIAAISAATVWEARDAEGNRLPNDNMESARLIISDLSKYGEVRSDNPATWITEHKEQMKKIQTIWAERNLPADQRTTYYLDPLAVYFGTPSDQRKTINFAQNIYGDTQAVTIDRHMYNLMAEYPEGVVHSANEYDAMEQVIRDLSEDSGIEPSTVQAILWGYRREILNREDERAMTGRRREQTERLKETYPAMRRGRWAATIADIIAKKPKERRSISAAKREALVADISRRFGIAPEMIRPQIKLLSDDLDGTVEDEILNLFEEAVDRLRDPESDIFEMREALVDIAILTGLAADKDGSEQTYRLSEPDPGAIVLFGGPPVTEHENVVMLGEIPIPRLPRKVTRGVLARMLKEADEPTLAFLAADLADSGSALRLAQVEAEIERRRVLEAFWGPDREQQIAALAEMFQEHLHPRGHGGKFTRKFTVDLPKEQGGGRQEIEVEYREATDEDRKALKIPPAWTEVYVTDHPTHPLRAMGKDSKGRTQRRYSAEFLEENQAAKFERLRQFDTARESIVKATANDNTDNAMVVRLIALTGVRPGSEKDTGGNKKAYGATTIQKEHVTLKGNKISLDFVGKEGIDNHFEVEDPILAKWMKKRLTELEPGQQVFHGANDKSARAWMARNGGSGFLLKDFRTWIATATALRLVKEGSPPPPEDEKDFQRRRKEIGAVVSKMLNNTPQMALGNYISPAVFDQWRM